MQLDSERAERAVAERDRRLQIDAVQLQVDGLKHALAHGSSCACSYFPMFMMVLMLRCVVFFLFRQMRR